MLKPKATFFAGTDGLIYFRSYGFVQEFVDDIKKNIKGKLKGWNPQSKLWFCDPAALDAFSEIANRYYDCTFIKDESSAMIDKFDGDPYAEFLRCLPNSILKKLYIFLVKECHPDRGGNQSLMTNINSLWSIIKKDRNIK